MSFIILFLALSPDVPFYFTSASFDSNSAILTFSEPALTSFSSTLDYVRVGDNMVVVTAVRNNDEIHDREALVIIEVRDITDGTTVSLDWQTGTILSGSRMDAGFSWVPQHAGEYELRTFGITSFEEPEILSSISSSEVSIASVRNSYPILIANKTFDVRYSFTSSEGTVQSVKVDASAPAIIAAIDVAKDTSFEVIFPSKMLERLETQSGYHYCVGNEFVAFVNDVPSDYDDFRFTGAEQILTIPVKKGLNTIEIIGTDLLQSPTTCLHIGLEHYSFAKDFPGVEVDTWNDAVLIARDHLDSLAQGNGEEKGAVRGGPIGSVELVYLEGNGTAFMVNRYDGLLEDVYPSFDYSPPNSYFWIVTLNLEEDNEKPEHSFIIDAQTREVKELFSI